MSAPAAAAHQPAAGASLHAAPPRDACPLCGSPLAPDQEWCLHCGAAARTRLAATPNWRWPLIAVAAVVATALAVLAVALVKLAGDSGPAPAPVTQTVTTPATPPASTVPGASTTPSRSRREHHAGRDDRARRDDCTRRHDHTRREHHLAVGRGQACRETPGTPAAPP